MDEWTKDEDMLLEATMRVLTHEDHTWSTTAMIMEVDSTRLGIKQRNYDGSICFRHYLNALIYLVEQFEPRPAFLHSFTQPWSTAEFEVLCSFIYYTVPGGRALNDPPLSWQDIAARMNADHNGPRRYYTSSVYEAWKRRIEPEFR
jgi:hypothetical protein